MSTAAVAQFFPNNSFFYPQPLIECPKLKSCPPPSPPRLPWLPPLCSSDQPIRSISNPLIQKCFKKHGSSFMVHLLVLVECRAREGVIRENIFRLLTRWKYFGKTDTSFRYEETSMGNSCPVIVEYMSAKTQEHYKLSFLEDIGIPVYIDCNRRGCLMPHQLVVARATYSPIFNITGIKFIQKRSTHVVTYGDGTTHHKYYIYDYAVKCNDTVHYTVTTNAGTELFCEETVTATGTTSSGTEEPIFKATFNDGYLLQVDTPNRASTRWTAVGYKATKMIDSDDFCITKLGFDDTCLITKAPGSNGKIRANKATVLAIAHITTDLCDNDVYDMSPTQSKSCYYTTSVPFVYTVGETVEVFDFETDPTEECAPGIHFYFTPEQAMNHCDKIHGDVVNSYVLEDTHAPELAVCDDSDIVCEPSTSVFNDDPVVDTAELRCPTVNDNFFPPQLPCAFRKPFWTIPKRTTSIRLAWLDLETDPKLKHVKYVFQ